MLQVDVMGEDNHMTTLQIDSVLEVPEIGTTIVCGRCHNKTKIRTVGAPYRPPSNGQHEEAPTDTDQIKGI